jgi:hypothetical protein
MRLHHRKDQVMTVCKVALANLVMWTRDQYFPASYAHATWHRLAPFFRIAGTVVPDASTVHVELRPFNDRTLNRDLAMRMSSESIKLPLDSPLGRLLSFTMNPACCLSPLQKEH